MPRESVGAPRKAMQDVINRRDLTYKALAGFIGGAVGWFPVELSSRGHSLTEAQTTTTFITGMLSMAILSGLIGGMINAAHLQELRLSPAVKRRLVQGFVICAILSIPATYYSNYAFTYILTAGGWRVNQQGSLESLIAARLAGWMLMGVMLGAGVGIATFSLPNVLKGAAGGLAGGFLGGLVFDAISNATGGGLPSRLFGLSLIGLAIGLFIGVVQELTKAAWLKVEAGRLRGREFRLEKATSLLGKAEESDVGLFGDPEILPRHAIVQRNGADFIIKDLSRTPGTLVNGQRVESARLQNGDLIKLGSYEVRFYERKAQSMTTAVPFMQRPAGANAALPPGPSPAAAQTVADAGAGPRFIDQQGRLLQLRAGEATRIGRSLDNDLVVPHQSVSRHHAAIAMVNGTFHLQDLGSQNGSYVAGQRVSQAQLRDGDTIRLGDAEFQFRA